MNQGLTRRQFLGAAGGIAGLALGGTVVWSRLVDDQVQEQASSTTVPRRDGRILVVLEINGGNDGLNTLVPAAGTYRDLRPTLGIAESSLVPLEGRTDFALHPELAPLAPLWAAGQLAAIHGIGFHEQTRSHFAEMDRWRAGGGDASWLGRWLDATAGEQETPLRAIGLGTDTRVLTAANSLSTVVQDPASFQLLAPQNAQTDPDAVVAAFLATSSPVGGGPQFAAAQQSIPATRDAVDVFREATAGTAAATAPQPGAPPDKASRYFEVASRLIELDVGAEVIVVGIDGFDTHANQPGRHDLLLADIAQGLSGFVAEMERQGRSDDVLVVTTSEFGRRVAENGSDGTDHGKANVLFVTGTQVNGQIVGEVGLDAIDDEGDLPVEIDARSLYAIALDWLGGPTDEILAGSYDRFGII